MRFQQVNALFLRVPVLLYRNPLAIKTRKSKFNPVSAQEVVILYNHINQAG
jgi:hypothetical protein